MDILIICLLIVGNGVLAMSEMALVSARKARLRQAEEEGSPAAATALRLVENPSHFLSTVQVGITSIGILSGAFGETAIAGKLKLYFDEVPALAAYSEELAMGLMVVGVTYLSLIFGELVPKRLALHHAERITLLVAPPMRLLSLLAYPLVRFLSFSTEMILRGFGIGQHQEQPVSEEEIKILLEQGAEAGVFEKREQQMLVNVFKLDDHKIVTAMTPRIDIIAIDVDNPLAENTRKLVETPHTYLPVCKGGLENILGIADSKHLLAHALSKSNLEFIEAVYPPLYVPESITLMQSLELFKHSQRKVALIVDEYGEIQGLVTLNDVLMAIVEERPSLTSGGDPEVVQREDGSWLIDGMYPIEKFKELFEIDELAGEHSGYFHTLSGFMMWKLGRVPAVTDNLDSNGLHLEIVDMDKNRVDKVLVSKRPPAGSANGA